MSAVVILVIALCVFALAYRYYAAFIAAKVLALDDARTTPAVRLDNGHDYIPTNKWVVFGHHFAAIAGAGPLIGPTLAAQYGWGPGFLWILIGSVFAGGVQDMIILFASVRHDGHSLSIIARRDVGRVTGFTTAVAVCAIIIVALAGLAIAVVNALSGNPWGVFSIGMTIPIAMGVGLYMFKLRPGAIVSGSAIGVALVCAAVFAGPYVAGSGISSWFTFGKRTLSIMLPIYGFCAAALPVWLLLAPRDYLSAYLKIGVVAVLALGLAMVNPPLKMSFVTRFVSGGGPIIAGPWWPYVFITIACGAISGFHALISSGTTPKLVENERQILFVGYGAMLAEAFVSLMALVAACTLVPADYYAINSSAEAFAKLGLKVADLPLLNSLVGLDVAHRPGGAISLAVGMTHIFSGLGEGVRCIMRYVFQFIIMFEALFILTTIDAGTRVARYILQDLFGYVYEPFHNVSWLPGMVITSALVSLAWGYLLYTGDISSIWPLFGVTNQTLAALALAVGTVIVLRVARRKRYALVTAVPCVFLTVVTFTAGWLNFRMFHAQGREVHAWLSIGIIAVVSVVMVDTARVCVKLLHLHEPTGLNTIPEGAEPSLDVPD